MKCNMSDKRNKVSNLLQQYPIRLNNCSWRRKIWLGPEWQMNCGLDLIYYYSDITLLSILWVIYDRSLPGDISNNQFSRSGFTNKVATSHGRSLPGDISNTQYSRSGQTKMVANKQHRIASSCNCYQPIFKLHLFHILLCIPYFFENKEI